MADSLSKQIDEIKHHDLLFWGLIALAVAVIIWLLLRKHPVGKGNTYNLTDNPAYNIPGLNLTVNPPANGFAGDTYNLGGNQSDQIMPGPPCACGCSGGNSGAPTTFNFPNFGDLFDTTIAALTAADTALIAGMTSQLPYGERTYVTNATNTPFFG